MENHKKRQVITIFLSWDIGIKGEVSDEQCILLVAFKERRRKQWAKIGIDWMDGMTLTLRTNKYFF
jgi:hypothetical protein